MTTARNLTALLVALILACALAPAARADSQAGPYATQRTAAVDPDHTVESDYRPVDTYSMEEIIDAGHHFFGATTAGLAQAVEYVFQRAGRPSAYIIGEEGSGAFFGGLRYGEGTLYMKSGVTRKVYWQGPSLGFDIGGNGARTMTLVYNMSAVDQIFDRFTGVEGTAYVVGGFGLSFGQNDVLRVAPIRTGLGWRLGANIGYLKYTPEPTWNPF